MRIAELKTHVLEAQLSQAFAWSFTGTATRTSCVVEVICEDGTTGWGECFGPARLNAPILAAFRPHVIGMDALASEQIWQHLYSQFRDQGQRGLTLTALSGLDIALWDIKGKRFQAPAHVLMGGPLRRQVQAYATGTYRRGSADTMSYIVDEVSGYVQQGFAAVKLKIGFGVAADCALIRACREAIGPKVGLMLDANHGYDAIEAVALGRAIAHCDIGWFEEPVVPEDLASYQEVRRGQPIPVAGGETWFARWNFKEALSAAGWRQPPRGSRPRLGAERLAGRSPRAVAAGVACPRHQRLDCARRPLGRFLLPLSPICRSLGQFFGAGRGRPQLRCPPLGSAAQRALAAPAGGGQ